MRETVPLLVRRDVNRVLTQGDQHIPHLFLLGMQIDDVNADDRSGARAVEAVTDTRER